MTSPMNPNMAANLPPIGLRRVVYLEANRAPLVTDTKYRDGSYYENNTEWRDNSVVPPNIYKLAKVNSKTNATWFNISSAFSSGVASLSGDANTFVFPDPGTGNIQIEGTAGQITVTEDVPGFKMVLALDTGQLLDSIGVDTTSGAGTNPVVPDINGLITVNGDTKAAGTVPVRTISTAANQYDIQVQISQAIATTDATKVGLSTYDNTIFTVDPNGFVSLLGGAVPVPQKFNVDAHTAPGTDPVVATSLGVVNITGDLVAAGTVPIQTNSLAANTITIEVQTSQDLAAADATKVGLSNFDSAQFAVDADGFVQLANGTAPVPQKWNVDANTGPGTDPVIASALGVINITGAQVAAGTIGANVIRTDSLAANTITIEVQQSAASVAKDTTKNGVAHFKSSQFTVDEGFVTFTGATGSTVQQVRTTTTTSVSATKTLAPTGTTPTTANTDLIISLSCTPTNASNILVFDFTTPFGMDNDGVATFALFQGTTFITAFPQYVSASLSPTTISVRHYMVAGTTSATTYSVRAAMPGGSVSTLRTLQNGAGTALYGGAGNTATQLIITEEQV